MAANTSPIFGRTPDVQLGGAVLGPNAQTGTTPAQGIDANTVSIFQADANEGNNVQQVILKAVGTTAATLARLYMCSVTGAFTPGTSNTLVTTSLIREIQLPAFTASAVAASPDYSIAVNMVVPPGYRLLLGFGTSTGAAGNGYQATTVGMKY